MNILMNGLNSFTGILIAGTLLKKGHKVIAITSGNEQRLNKNQKKELEILKKNKNFYFFINDYNFSKLKAYLIDFDNNIDVFLIHGFKALDYKNEKLNAFNLIEESLFWLEPIAEILKKKSCKLVSYTSTYFENFLPSNQTPYSIAKSMGWIYLKRVFSDFKLLKYKFNNPYGPLESNRFSHSIISNWIEDKDINIAYPYLIRDNIPAYFLIDDYINTIKLSLNNSQKIMVVSPSYIVESNLEFANRIGNKLKNYGFKCKINISNNLETNLVQGEKNIRDKYIFKEEEFFDNYFKKALEKN